MIFNRLIKGLFLLIFFYFCFACNDRKNGSLGGIIKLSADEDSAIHLVANTLGGECQPSVGVSTEIAGNHKFFEIELSKSPFIDKYRDKPHLVASATAHIFYSRLTEQKNTYGEIRSVLLTGNGEKITYKFPVEQLQLVEQKFSVLDSVVSRIEKKQWQSLQLQLQDSPLLPIPSDELVKNLSNAENQLGRITKLKHFGFEFEQINSVGQVLHLHAIVNRDKQGTEFKLDLNPAPADNQLYLINYHF
ncbi:hypothetical protein QNI16_35870 [Cytophagaceae bacterium YF14B1]|uniref:Uncharacterized protein n=1 Tax=Xanthocytophaga flava TaxID=3048013 RepID=A0AAE3QYK8_9BACT|nr:hypothetical protein [Xanthocytophaga flavus]MDJ1485915.1 hypothetical protein [Xanthocytophaga flavus]